MGNDVKEIVLAAVSPLNKLIDLVSKGIGTIYEPYKIRKHADAMAYKLEVLSKSIGNTNNVSIEYKDENLQIQLHELQERAMQRFVYQEVQRQFNIEDIADKTADILKNREIQSNEDVSFNWISRFIDSAKDVTESEIKDLWAKVLAGEIIQPNTVSLRTLDVLKNMSKKDAELFMKVMPFIINNSYIPNSTELLAKYGISYDDILKLDECGLINSSGMVSSHFNINSDNNILFNNENIACIIKSNNERNMEIREYVLTKSGTELKKIIGIATRNDFLIDYAKEIKKQYSNMHVCVHIISSIDENGKIITYNETIDLITSDDNI